MKRIKVLLSTLVLMAGLSGQAYADFAKGSLTRVVYDSAGKVEQLTDLGPMMPTTPTTSNTRFTANPISFSSFASGNANLRVAYYVNSQNKQVWISGPTSASGTSTPRHGPSFNGASVVIGVGAAAISRRSGGTGNVILPDRAAWSQSYSNRMNFGGRNPGWFNQFLNMRLPGNGEASLAALDTVGYVDLALYYYSNYNAGGVQGLKVATIRTYADGTTQLNPNAVPLPAAVYLFGTGLLGLVGVRRKIGA